MSPAPCTHADAGEAVKEAIAAHVDAYHLPKRDKTRAAKVAEATRRVESFTRCPDCGRWREGER